MINKIIFAYILVFLIPAMFIGCATAKRMNRLSVGMSKQEVYSTMGEPMNTASHKSGVEFLRYNLPDSPNAATREYYVRLIDGKVESFGRMGDFDSTKNPTIGIDFRGN